MFAAGCGVGASRCGGSSSRGDLSPRRPRRAAPDEGGLRRNEGVNSRSTAGRLVLEARRAELLGPALGTKAGEEEL